MNKCEKCNVIIRDDSNVCPLCRCVTSGEGGENTYPDIRLTVRRLKKLSRIILFCILMVSAIVLSLNLKFYDGTLWSLIVIGAMAYGYHILRFVVISSYGYRSKVFSLVIYGVLLVVLIDWVTGFNKWSLDYVLPGGLMLVDGIILLMMLINIRSWQSYIPLQILTLVVSLSPFLLWALGLITHPLLSIIALAISFFFFIGTLMIGDRRAVVELKRRFHI